MQTLLYVEDEPDDVFFMREAIQRAGLRINLVSVEDGRKAVEYLSGKGVYADRAAHPLPQAVLLDLNLPFLSGFEVLDWIRTHPSLRQMPVVIFSSSGYPKDRERAEQLMATAYFQKPSSGVDFAGIAKKIYAYWAAVPDDSGGKFAAAAE